ncbi:MAG: hypothetical protein WC827_02855 [Candidatus Paceibacterota bacterium]|jgi:hypothetical protein
MFNFNKKIIFFFLVFFISFFTNNVIYSQEVIKTNDIVKITTTPQNPAPGEAITANLSSYLVNLDTSKIVWYIDGIIKKEGIGEKSFTIKAKGVGQSTVVKVIISTKDGSKIETSVEVIPNTISLIIEPISYTPLFYKGKPSFTFEGQTKVVVMSEIINPITNKKISPDNLIFKWKEDGIVRGSSSGLGKNYIIIKSSIPIEDIFISVEISDTQNSFVLNTSKILQPSKPKVILYENSPIYGILYNKSLPLNYFLGDKEEIKITAEPFFFDKKENLLSRLSYFWEINNKPIEQPEIKNEIILKQVDKETKGTTHILLNTEDEDKLFQFTKNNIYINYGE